MHLVGLLAAKSAELPVNFIASDREMERHASCMGDSRVLGALETIVCDCTPRGSMLAPAILEVGRSPVIVL
jgi:hypothetical protein